MTSEISFTKTFKQYRSFGYHRSFIYGFDNPKHPFIYQEKNLNLGAFARTSKDIFDINQKVKEEEKKSFTIVELETSLLSNHNTQIKYINECLEILIRLHNISKKENEYSYEYDGFSLYPLIQNSVKNLIISISNKFAYLLNPNNRDYYFSLIEIRKPILSFRLSKKIRDEHFYKLCEDHIVNAGFIHPSDVKHFKSFFEGRRLEGKINWDDSKNSLCYLIKQLIKNGTIQKHTYSHWKVTAEFFLIEGKPILPKKLLNQGKPENTIKVNNIDNFVRQLL